jgi:hypothetical protein
MLTGSAFVSRRAPGVSSPSDALIVARPFKAENADVAK